MPLIENDENGDKMEEFSGRRKLEHKVSKLERILDGISKEIDIKIEKRMF